MLASDAAVLWAARAAARTERAAPLLQVVLVDDYRALLKASKASLGNVDGLDEGNEKFMAQATKMQDDYVSAQNDEAMRQGKAAAADAAKLYSKWHNPYKGTQWAKYDAPSGGEYKARTQALAEGPASEGLSQLNLAAQRTARKARAACKGETGCEKILDQVMQLYKK